VTGVLLRDGFFYIGLVIHQIEDLKLGQYEKHHVMIPVQYLSGLFLAIVETSSGFRSSCYWTDWNRANTENIRIGLVFAVLAQMKVFILC
jgi:hypothetical protein